MSELIKIAVIGDFNFTFNTHHATNLAIDHSKNLLEVEANYYWIRINEATRMKVSDYSNYDAVWVAPGPFSNTFFLHGVLKVLLESKLPLLITGEGYKQLIEVLINQFNLNPNNEKLISDNLAPENNFEKVDVIPLTESMKKMYQNMGRSELCSARYSLYPQLIDYLKKEVIDIEAINHYDDPEVISLKNHPFCVASMSVPQICSTREMPHPLISSFLNYAHLTASNMIERTA